MFLLTTEEDKLEQTILVYNYVTDSGSRFTMYRWNESLLVEHDKYGLYKTMKAYMKVIPAIDSNPSAKLLVEGHMRDLISSEVNKANEKEYEAMVAENTKKGKRMIIVMLIILCVLIMELCSKC